MYNASIPSTLSLEVQGIIIGSQFVFCVAVLFVIIGIVFFNYKLKCCKKKKKIDNLEEGVDLEREKIRKDKQLQQEFFKELG
jgi:hypothetical protein